MKSIDAIHKQIDEKVARLMEALNRPHAALPPRVKLEDDKELMRFVACDFDHNPDNYPLKYWQRVSRRPGASTDFEWHNLLAAKSTAGGGDISAELGYDAMTKIKEYLCESLDQFNTVLQKYDCLFLADSFHLVLRIAVWRYISSSSDGEFARRIDGAISAGGIPCGLEGDSEEGDLLVYWPHDVEPVFTASDSDQK